METIKQFDAGDMSDVDMMGIPIDAEEDSDLTALLQYYPHTYQSFSASIDGEVIALLNQNGFDEHLAK